MRTINVSKSVKACDFFHSQLILEFIFIETYIILYEQNSSQRVLKGKYL